MGLVGGGLLSCLFVLGLSSSKSQPQIQSIPLKIALDTPCQSFHFRQLTCVVALRLATHTRLSCIHESSREYSRIGYYCSFTGCYCSVHQASYYSDMNLSKATLFSLFTFVQPCMSTYAQLRLDGIPSLHQNSTFRVANYRENRAEGFPYLSPNFPWVSLDINFKFPRE